MANKIDRELASAIKGFNSTFSRGGSWFDFFAENATIYPANSTTPIKGRKAYQKNFDGLLRKGGRKANVLQQDVRTMGETTVVMQLLEVIQEGVTTNLRESSIWQKLDDGWKIIHLHAAIVGTPRSSALARTPNAIKILREKIAVVSSQVGVAQ